MMSADSTWASRSGMPVSSEAMSIVAATDDSARSSPTTTSTSKRWNRPRTLETPRWRIVKPTELWAASSAQRPGARGRGMVIVVDGMVMGP